jgi:hypothetical protein
MVGLGLGRSSSKVLGGPWACFLYQIGIARGRSRVVLLAYSLTLFPSSGLFVSTPFIMVSSEVEMSDSDTTSTLSESLGTEILEARSMVLAEYRERPEAEPFSLNGRKFLKVDHVTNIRMGSPISKLWRSESQLCRKHQCFREISVRNTWAHWCRRPLHPHTNFVSYEPNNTHL